MTINKLISSERQCGEARAAITRLEYALSSKQILESIVAGLPKVAVEGINKALVAERNELKNALDAYQRAKEGEIEPLKLRAGNDPGLALVVARIAQGLSQKELARKLGIREQKSIAL